ALRGLRDPSSRLWLELREQGPSSPWFELVSQLDNRCFVADAIQRDADQWIERELDKIQAATYATTRAHDERGGEDNVYLIDRNISDLVRATGSLLRWSNAEDDGGRLTSALRRPLAISNFYMAALGLQACYMQRAAPISLIALREVLSSLSGPNTDGPV